MRTLRRSFTFIAALSVAVIVAIVAVLKSMDFNEFKGVIERQIEAETGRDLTIGGNLQLALSTVPLLTVDKVSFANAPNGSRSQMATLERLEIEVELVPLFSRQVKIKRLVFQGLDLLLERDESGKGNWEVDRPASPPSEDELTFEPIQLVAIRNGRVTYKDRKLDHQFDLGLVAMDIRSGGTFVPIAFDADGGFEGTNFEVSGQLPSWRQMLADTGPLPVKLDIKAFGVVARIDGRIERLATASGVDLDVKADIPRWTSLAGFVKDKWEISLPVLPSTSFSGRLRDDGPGWSITGLAMKAGKSDLSGRVALSTAGPRPLIEADVTAQILDLTELLPPGDNKNRPAAVRAPDGKVFSVEPLSFEGLTAFDMNLALRAGRVETSFLPFATVETKATLMDGQLNVSTLRFSIAEGTASLTGSLAVAAGFTDVDAHFVASGLGVPRLIEAYGGAWAETGHLQGDVSIKARGASIAELMASLNGRGELVLEEARITNESVSLAEADLAKRMFHALNPFTSSKNYTDVRCAVLAATAENGLVVADNGIAAETGEFFVLGSGRLNLKTEEIDVAIKPEGRRDLGINLGEFASMVRLRGSLAEPELGLDRLETLKEAASIGAAIATYGLSFLAQRLIRRATGEGKPCQIALGRGEPSAESAPPPRDPEENQRNSE